MDRRTLNGRKEIKRKYGKNLPNILIETMTAAKQKDLQDNDQAKASIFQSLLEVIDPVDSP